MNASRFHASCSPLWLLFRISWSRAAADRWRVIGTMQLWPAVGRKFHQKLPNPADCPSSYQINMQLDSVVISSNVAVPQRLQPARIVVHHSKGFVFNYPHIYLVRSKGTGFRTEARCCANEILTTRDAHCSRCVHFGFLTAS